MLNTKTIKHVEALIAFLKLNKDLKDMLTCTIHKDRHAYKDIYYYIAEIEELIVEHIKELLDDR